MTKKGIIGLTGGIASGKSTISELFAQKNVPIIDADIIAREVVQKGSQGLQDIVKHYGESILLPSGELNRPALRDIIFNNESERQWLNQCVHPLIQQETDRRVAQISAPYLIWAVPLLIENRLMDRTDRILVIDLPTQLQIKRLIEREKIEESLANKIIQSQISREERLAYADDIIVNDGEINVLKEQVDKLHRRYLTLFSQS